MVRKVVAANPKETRQVQARQAEITDLWDKLKVHVSRVPLGSTSNAGRRQLEPAYYVYIQ